MEEEDNMNKASTIQKPPPKKKYKARGPITGIKGTGKVSFATEMGVVARGIKITYGPWPDVPEGKKETIWLHVKKKFNIEDDSKREVVLKIVGGRYKGFKTRLTRDYIYKKGNKKRVQRSVTKS